MFTEDYENRIDEFIKKVNKVEQELDKEFDDVFRELNKQEILFADGYIPSEKIGQIPCIWSYKNNTYLYVDSLKRNANGQIVMECSDEDACECGIEVEFDELQGLSDKKLILEWLAAIVKIGRSLR
jgi:hypothetical protein